MPTSHRSLGLPSHPLHLLSQSQWWMERESSPRRRLSWRRPHTRQLMPAPVEFLRQCRNWLPLLCLL
ncbi:hypothetical protein E2C01_006971 [Portunus trituberculatus]|uniref:Uncharacterized protein n=1 Tax=Portunus trituberculatus TaxID=210409 RepID=A0A5B7CZ88_PORTR|nr:hypothetical protein [Portunus trituberculatus]